MRIFKWLIGIVLVLGLVYFAGPHPTTPVYTAALPTVPSNATELEATIDLKEKTHNTRPNNEARIVWANDSIKQKTPFAIVTCMDLVQVKRKGIQCTKIMRKHLVVICI